MNHRLQPLFRRAAVWLLESLATAVFVAFVWFIMQEDRSAAAFEFGALVKKIFALTALLLIAGSVSGYFPMTLVARLATVRASWWLYSGLAVFIYAMLCVVLVPGPRPWDYHLVPDAKPWNFHAFAAAGIACVTTLGSWRLRKWEQSSARDLHWFLSACLLLLVTCWTAFVVHLVAAF